MGILLYDVNAEAAYDKAQQKYAEEIEKRSSPSYKGDRNAMWPEPPRRPEPFADSTNKNNAQPMNFGVSPGFRGGSATDPDSSDKEVTDGTAGSTPKGFAVINPNPFKLGR